ncbi:MAG: sulfite exporter TauE/SafE family protein [Ramlibacter sp.]|nr:sulfite exporter TauE/SafE family protein [Ramlibacter sp.]
MPGSIPPPDTKNKMSLLDPLLIAELLLIGTVTGFLAGLLGIGGGMVMVPFVTMILTARGFPAEYTVKMAVATSLATICFTSLSSVRAHNKRGAVLWPVARVLAPGILVGSVAGAQLAVALPGKMLGILFGSFVAFSATQMILDRKPKPTRTLPGPIPTFGVGTLIGVVSALVGAGGAFISVPFMTWCNVKIHQAVGTSSALGFPIALAGTAGYIWAGRDMPPMPPGSIGYLYLPGLVCISLASMLLAPLGARTAHRMDTRPLRKLFALVLYGLATYFLLLR